jgi:hypothetical protein
VELSFLSPFAVLIGLAVAIPIAAAVVRERRHGVVRQAVGLGDPPGRSHTPEIVALAVTFGLLAAAAAQPVVRVPGTVQQRTDAEAYVVIDTTRSMLAARAEGDSMRIQRAKELAVEIRRALPDVPFGVASHTNRSLPHMFPGADADQFELVVNRAVGVNRPPGTRKQLFAVSTDFSALETLATDNFFSADSTKRLAIVLSDGESQEFSAKLLADDLRKGGVELLLVRFWNEDERVWQPNGQAEPRYRPNENAYEHLVDLAALTTGGRVYGEDELDTIIAAARNYLGTGPVVTLPAPGRTVSVAPYAVLAACIPLGLLLLFGLLAGWGRRPQLAYSMLARWRASSTPGRLRSRETPARSPQISSVTRSPMGVSSPGSD